jgi:hypothetical protein
MNTSFDMNSLLWSGRRPEPQHLTLTILPH